MAKKIKKYKVGCDSETLAISLVEFPAIESDFVALEKQEEVKVMLANEERHMVYGAALIPDKDIYRNDGEKEYYINFTKESISKMSQDFMKEYRQHEVTLDHEDIANEICVVESWLVEDPYRDKANALGINVPEGTWMVGMKVNNLEAWERVREGSLKGFSVESLISLEEFGKQNDNNMNIETNEMFWDKLINVLKETFSKKEEEVEKVEIKPTNIELEETPVETSTEAPKAEETPKAEEPKVEEPKVEEPKAEEPKTEEPKPQPQDNHLEELINNLKEEIASLKEMNSGLNKKIKELGKTPSAQPVNTNAKPNAGDTYASWREQMRNML